MLRACFSSVYPVISFLMNDYGATKRLYSESTRMFDFEPNAITESELYRKWLLLSEQSEIILILAVIESKLVENPMLSACTVLDRPWLHAYLRTL